MGYLGVMAKLGPLARRDVCAELRGVLERLITHLCLLVEVAAMLVDAVDIVDAVEVVGAMGAVTAVHVVGTVVVLLA